MLKRSQAGFTLVETTIALAISSGLAILAFSGFNTLQKQLQFSAAVEGAKDFITEQRTEVNATIQTSDADGTQRGSSDGTINFGRLLKVTESGFTVQTLRMKNVNKPADDEAVEIAMGDTNDIRYNMQWGATFSSVDGSSAVDREIAFVRSPLDGSLQTYVSEAGGFPMTNGHYEFVSFKNFVTTSPFPLTIRSPDDKTARVIIDPKSNAISRQFD